VADRRANLEITWPLFETGPKGEPIPASPIQELSAYAPPQAELDELEQGAAVDSEHEARSEADARARSTSLSDSHPPGAPDWMRAARGLADALEAMLARGKAAPEEQAAVARTWAAWSLGGVAETQILKVSHLVSRTHAALHARRDTPHSASELQAAAGVLYQGLPGALRQRMPRERVLLVVEELARLPDAWVAVVEGSSELLGWKHYGRVHAASAIRRVMDRAGKNVST